MTAHTTIKNDFYLVFRTFTTGYRLVDAVFGIAYAMFDGDGVNHGSGTLVHSIVPQTPGTSEEHHNEDEDENEYYANFPTTSEEWRYIWGLNLWSSDYFDKIWKPNIKLLERIQMPSNINCVDSGDVLHKFYTEVISFALKQSPNPILIDVNNTWAEIYPKMALVENKTTDFILNVNVIDFKSFALGVSRSDNLYSLKQYENFYEVVVGAYVATLNTTAVDDTNPEIRVFAQHVLYLHAYLNQKNLSQIVQPTLQLMLGLIVVGIFAGIFLSILF